MFQLENSVFEGLLIACSNLGLFVVNKLFYKIRSASTCKFTMRKLLAKKSNQFS